MASVYLRFPEPCSYAANPQNRDMAGLRAAYPCPGMISALFCACDDNQQSHICAGGEKSWVLTQQFRRITLPGRSWIFEHSIYFRLYTHQSLFGTNYRTQSWSFACACAYVRVCACVRAPARSLGAGLLDKPSAHTAKTSMAET